MLLEGIEFGGVSSGPPVVLSNIKSFSICYRDNYLGGTLSTLFRIPALQRLSSLSIGDAVLYSIGDDIEFTLECDPKLIMEAWQELTMYTRPIIQHSCLENIEDLEFGGDQRGVFMGVHTLEIGQGKSGFHSWDDIKGFGPQLKTIRFEILEETEPPRESGEEYEAWGGSLLDDIEEPVAYGFAHGRPFSSVEGVVVSGSEQVNRQQDFVWRCF